MSSRTFEVQGERIPSITENPIHCLRKWFDKGFGNTNYIIATAKQLEEWLQRIDTTTLPGKLKVLCFHHTNMQRLGWPFTMYDFPQQ